MPCCTWLSLAQPCGWWPVAWCWSAGAHSSLEPHRPVPGGPPRPPCGAPHNSLHCPEALGAVQTAAHEPCSAGPVAPQPTGEMCSSDQFGTRGCTGSCSRNQGGYRILTSWISLSHPALVRESRSPGYKAQIAFPLTIPGAGSMLCSLCRMLGCGSAFSRAFLGHSFVYM